MHLFTMTKLEYKAEHQMYNVNSGQPVLQNQWSTQTK